MWSILVQTFLSARDTDMKKTIVCVCYTCMCVCMHVCMSIDSHMCCWLYTCVCTCRCRPQNDVGCLHSLFSFTNRGTVSQLIRACWLASLANQLALGIPLISTFQDLVLQDGCCLSTIYTGSGNLNSSPHAWGASTLSSEASPQLPKFLTWDNSKSS